MLALKWGFVLASILSGALVSTKALVNPFKSLSLNSSNQSSVSTAESTKDVSVFEDEKQSQESSTIPVSQTTDLENSVQSIAPPKTKQLTQEEIKKQAESVFEKLDDYTFKLFSNCNTGTGWILDYQIPDQKDKYPLVWYIATNAHVIRQWYFDQSNPYNQVLPEKLSEYRQRYQDYYTHYSSKYYSLYSGNNCYYKRNYGAFDMNLSKQSSGQNMKSDIGAIYQRKIKKPKLFWTALNIFDENQSLGIGNNNFKDFAVIEIEFQNEKVAREMTRDFATKYGGENSKNSINLFGSPISKERLKDNNENFYSLGYPTKENDKFSYSKTWNPETLAGEKLAEDPRKSATVNQDKRLMGHVSAKSFNASELDWGGKKYSRMGHFYLLEGFPLGKGASGSMTVDGEGNLIGLKSRGEVGEKAKYSMILPIRSGNLEVEGDFKTPKYDLILGAEGQKTSYKEQVEKYGKKTWLSSMGWKHNSENLKIN
ncbi:hypothetical protein OVS_02330 [Mycoplasma ovis str. Michigan]|uniref:DUF31 domain-containing protein n=1 Tax=Mycoplasma ovis str. Michigan TaxID=1415773 RepID=A0ABM5P1K4_9MOLU|nr:hypothetical protein [Mycoplasma ovis]AHC40319.1 hypothetical protein OVS_02330 [Mycoplasma ovis str. Michigan]